ncbi:hypothetical protein [Bdellovibrio svalbardensis]|uniref:EamA domain-containing protein n=1 Tax=Bdellovibrio svalbardensis TaxID=2972972 RepID=A0ABT6DR99_9BACT|nr:hypothetical protein [Bdellovibrio svalbardensis]MDG0817683.1 hypothetical protein [Bdellovibrio svalbardensis]
MNSKIIAILLSVFVTYSLYTYIGYHEGLRNSKYFILVGLALALTSNLLWLLGLRILNSSQSIFWLSLAFDITITVCSLYIPVILSKVKFNSFTWVGVALVVTGLMVIKNLGMSQE